MSFIRSLTYLGKRIAWTVAKISNLQYIEVLQSYGNPNTLKCFNILKCFNLMKVTIGLQHFNILGYHRIAILQYIANYLFLQRTLTFNVFYFPVEVSVCGQVSKGNRARLKAFLFRCCQEPRKLHSNILRVSSRAALLSSFSVFCARKEPSWVSPSLLTVRWTFLFVFIFHRTNFF